MEKIKKIISTFINIDANEINNDTVIDNSVIQGSILIHRMYAALANEGVKIEEYHEIKTYGELISKINSTHKSTTKDKKKDIIEDLKSNIDDTEALLGIDIETYDKFPEVPDYREDNFYKQNFSTKEITYCILQSNPRASFAGKFSAKEAIVKADNNFISVPFNKISIENNKQGKPLFKGFALSISHTDNIAIAIAQKQKSVTKESDIPLKDKKNISNNILFVLVMLSTLLSAISLIINLVLYF